jgi:maleylpyruvate isomerase
MTIDPRAKEFDAAELLAEISDASARLTATAEGLDDQEIREPSLLANWTRGHVLTHAARNADGLCNLLTWAATGERRDMYPSPEAKNADIEAGAVRTAAELATDLREAGQRFAESAARLSSDHWAAHVERLPGAPYRAGWIPWWRLEEVLVHHVDLDAGFSPAHWTAEFTGPELDLVAERLSDPDRKPPVRPFRLHTEDTTRSLGVACESMDPGSPLVRGPEAALLAWLIGRSGGDGLVVEPHDALPTVPAWN